VLPDKIMRQKRSCVVKRISRIIAAEEVIK